MLLQDFLNSATLEECECDEVENGNGIRNRQVSLFGEIDGIPTDIVINVITVFSGYNYSSDDPQKHIIGERTTTYKCTCYKDGEIIDIKQSGIVLPNNYCDVLMNYV